MEKRSAHNSNFFAAEWAPFLCLFCAAAWPAEFGTNERYSVGSEKHDQSEVIATYVLNETEAAYEGKAKRP